MKLRTMWIRGFRSLENVRIPFQPDLTVLIGENDSGKSSVLDLLEWILEAPYVSRKTEQEKRPKEADFFTQGEARVEEIQVILEFALSKEARDAIPLPEEWLLPQQDAEAFTFRLRVTYKLDEEPLFEVYTKVWPIPELGMDPKTLERKSKADLDAVLENLGLNPEAYGTKSEKAQAIINARSHVQGEWKWQTVKPKDLRFLPRIQRYRALEYQQPERFLEKTLKTVFADMLQDLQEAATQLYEHAHSRLEEEVQRLKTQIQRFLPHVRDISFQPDIRLEEAFRGGEFLIDTGEGLHPLSRKGDGTKRRMLMAVMEWEREVLKGIGQLMPVLRAYDEPDTNLHYNAQRQFFRTLRKILEDNPSQQAILCTHSLFMIDHAPAQSLVHLYRTEDGKTRVETLPVHQDSEVEQFLETVASRLGVMHSSLFFDRCFLLVEGETEYVTLPILYYKRYKRTLREDGIALIHLGGVKNPAVLFRLLGERRARHVLFLIDMDEFESKKQKLQAQGWDPTLIEKNVLSIGRREFEDAFSDTVWARVAQTFGPREDREWCPEDIAALRGEDKFSEALRRTIQRAARIKGGISKPLLGQRLAEVIEIQEIPEQVLHIFERARQIAGVEA